MRTLGDAIKDAVAAKGLTQEQVSRQVGIDRTTLSKYMNNHVDVPNDIKRSLVSYLSDPVLRIKFYGTTSSNIVFDKAHLEFYKSGLKAIEEFKEAIESIEEVLNFAYNINSEEELTDDQMEKFEKMLDEIEDANHACDMVDITAAELGADLDARNRRCYKKYRTRGYLEECEYNG
ncbi:helix-turn-helix protein [Halanaerobium saccharolyticum]|uniref:Helix-turn-helix protein n=1 Tax=Halanaerobium saccharolyticum TaxID=43595 RepID=A0A4R6LWR8_9FIRM|nr:helix-turn-helix transcriptional regulator [Halanaerobium saccharolyticum]TDO92300.1 helix-turn-helix protein [Halanaerobium saccharolyticum]